MRLGKEDSMHMQSTVSLLQGCIHAGSADSGVWEKQEERTRKDLMPFACSFGSTSLLSSRASSLQCALSPWSQWLCRAYTRCIGSLTEGLPFSTCLSLHRKMPLIPQKQAELTGRRSSPCFSPKISPAEFSLSCTA